MNTITRTYTRTDIRRVFENFRADLHMLAVRTQAMESNQADRCAYDVCVMAQEECLRCVHVQLYDAAGNLIKVHRYSVKKDILSDAQRPGGNRWPCLPSGTLCVIVEYSDRHKAEQLKVSGKLVLPWSPSSLSTDYSGMRNDAGRLYSSNTYGLRRDTFAV